MENLPKGTQGYAEQAEQLLVQYENFSFREAHQQVLHLIPDGPCTVLDIGAGTGRDAAYFADLGHRVIAVEPTDELRIPASRLHPSPAIEWVNDALPDLARIARRSNQFDLIMLTAVWMHLDDTERRRAMPAVASLLRPAGRMILSLRHGPPAPGRRMFQVSAEETIGLAEAEGLTPILNLHAPSTQVANRKLGISWTRLAFRCGE